MTNPTPPSPDDSEPSHAQGERLAPERLELPLAIEQGPRPRFARVSAWFDGLPFLKRRPVLAGVLSGIVLRLLFSGETGSAWSAMAIGFIFMAPMVVGAVTVYLAEKMEHQTWWYYLWAPFLANLLFVAGTLVFMIEGWICAIVIIPMFALLGSVGGVSMGLVCRLTHWPKRAMYSLASVPLLLGLVGNYLPTPDHFDSVQRSVVVNAPASVVWQHLNNTQQIDPAEFGGTWAARIGVPMPVSGKTERTAQGLVRKSHWQKAVHFDEPITHFEPERYLRWVYRFQPDSFPAGALDDHVLIGGHYFDLIDTSFTLSPVVGGTRLDIKAHYRVSTQFNFYAARVAQWLLNNLLATGLEFYKHRSEAGLPAQT